MNEKPHPGISMHKLSVGAGFPGVLFMVGCAAIFVLGLPALWYFVAFSAALGIAIALILHFANEGRSKRAKPLSILQASEREEAATQVEESRRQSLYEVMPRLHSA